MIASRFAFTPTETQARLIINGWSCYTIERPWIRGETPGGMPFESCIPDGTYELRRYTRPNNDKVLAMVNPDLGVYLHDRDRPVDENGQRQGRYLCLIHPANYVTEVQGCMAPGSKRLHTLQGIMVTSSQATMVELMRRARNEKTIEIRQAPGAIDTPLTEVRGIT